MNKSLIRPKFLVNIIYFLIHATIFLVPIFFIPALLSPFVEPRTFFFLGIVEIMAFFYVLLIFIDKQYIPKKNNITYSFLLFILLSVISGINSPDPINSFWSEAARFDTVIILFHLFIFFLVIVSTIKSEQVLRKIMWTSIISSLIVSFSVYIAYLGHFNIFYWYQNAGISIGSSLGGLIGNDSYTGVYLLFNVFFILYLLFNTEHRIKRYILETILIGILMSPIFFNFFIFKGNISINDIINNPTVLLGTSRAVALATILGVCIAIILYYLKSNNQKIKIFSRYLFLVFLFTSIFLSVLVFIPGSKPHDWFTEKTGGNRFIFWHQAYEGLKDRPLLGWGPGNFYLINQKYFDPSFAGDDYYALQNTSDKAHNIIFDTLSNVGIIGFMAYVSIYIFYLMILWKSKKISHINKSLFTGLVFAYLLQNMVFFDVLVSYLMFALLLASIIILDSDFSPIETEQQNKKKLNNIKIGFFVAVGLYIISLCINYFVLRPFSEAYLNFKFYNLPPYARLSNINERNVSLYGESKNAEAYARATIGWYLENIILIKNNDVKPYLKDLDGIINDIKENSPNGEVTFWGSNIIFQLLDIKYQLKNDPALFPEMHFYSERQISMIPKNVRGYINKGRVLFYEKKYLDSISTLEYALSFSPKNQGLYFLIIDVARTSGDKKVLNEKMNNLNSILSN